MARNWRVDEDASILHFEGISLGDSKRDRERVRKRETDIVKAVESKRERESGR